jgi:hypothetical protein
MRLLPRAHHAPGRIDLGARQTRLTAVARHKRDSGLGVPRPLQPFVNLGESKRAGHRVAFATATERVARLADAKRQANLEAELRRLGFVPLVVDEVGNIPFDPEAAPVCPSFP